MYSFHTARVGRRKPILGGLIGQERLWTLCPVSGSSGVHTPGAHREPMGRSAADLEAHSGTRRRRTKGHARLRFWAGSQGAAASPAPCKQRAPLPHCTLLPPPSPRPREMAAAPQNGSRAGSRAGEDLLPHHSQCRLEHFFFFSLVADGVRPRALCTTAAPRPYSGLPTRRLSTPQPTRGSAPLCERCLCSSKYSLCRSGLGEGAQLERTEHGTPARPPLPAQDIPWVEEGSTTPLGSPHSQR